MEQGLLSLRAHHTRAERCNQAVAHDATLRSPLAVVTCQWGRMCALRSTGRAHAKSATGPRPRERKSKLKIRRQQAGTTGASWGPEPAGCWQAGPSNFKEARGLAEAAPPAC